MSNSMAFVKPTGKVIVGVDTHKHVHVAVAIDLIGTRLATYSAPADRAGYADLILRGHTNILKRLLIHAGGFNLGLVMRHLIGIGTPRGLQGRVAAVLATLGVLMGVVRRRLTKCPRCKDPVFFFHCNCGAEVFFDRLGHPWLIHDCDTSWTRNLSRHRDSAGGVTVEIAPGIMVQRAPEGSIHPDVATRANSPW